MLNETALEPDFPLGILAAQTDGLSGSDLKELCRNAAMAPVRECMKKMGGDTIGLAKMESKVLLRPPMISRTITLIVYQGSQTQTPDA